jgi:glycosyltransferase involved in cell wall biosynthesis
MPDVRVMFHEPYFYFRRSRPWAASNALAIVQRWMTRLLLAGSTRVYYSTETWRRYLHPGDGRVAQALPIPSTIPDAASDAEIARARDAATAGDRGGLLVGHFGTYGAHVAAELREILPELVARMPGIRIALLGDGGPRFARDLAAVGAPVWAPGRLAPSGVAAALRACDVLLQPYPDGITTRRTSAMAGIGNGVATVTTSGALTEPVWSETGAVALAPAGDARAFVDAAATLLRDADARAALGRRASAAYAAHFSMEHTIAILRGAPAS